MPVLRFLFSGVCHQITERCLAYQGQPLPLCARCMGTYLGIAIACIVLGIRRGGRRSLLPSWRSGAALLALAAAWAIDGANSVAQLALGAGLLYESHNSLRLITGMGMGLAIGAILSPIYQGSMWREVQPRRVLDGPGDWLGLLLAAALTAAAVLLWPTAPFGFWVAVVSLTVIGGLSATNAVLIVLLWRKEGGADSYIDIIPYLAGGLLAALAEMSALGLLRAALLGYAG